MRDTHVRLYLLGPPRLSTPMGREVPLSRKAWGLLAYLHQASPRAVGRAELAALLWPESQGPQGRASLRTELATLRKAMAICGYPRINATKETVQLLLPKDAVDVSCLTDALRMRGETVTAAIKAFYRGPFMARLGIRSGPFEEWLLIERESLRNTVINALRDRLGAAEARSDRIAAAEMLVQFEPTDEEAYRVLMALYAGEGAPDKALRWYQTCRTVLERDLDAQPSYATRLLAHDIRQKATQRPRSRQVWRGTAVVVRAALLPSLAPATPRDPEHLLQADRAFANAFSAAVARRDGWAAVSAGGVGLALFREAADRALEMAIEMAEWTIGVAPGDHLTPTLALDVGDVIKTEDGTERELAGMPVLETLRALGQAQPGAVLVSQSLARRIAARWQLGPGPEAFFEVLRS